MQRHVQNRPRSPIYYPFLMTRTYPSSASRVVHVQHRRDGKLNMLLMLVDAGREKKFSDTDKLFDASLLS